MKTTPQAPLEQAELNNRVTQALLLAQDPMHKYLLGELAAALSVAIKALEEVAQVKPLFSLPSSGKDISAKALSEIQAMSGADVRLGETRLNDLVAEYHHLRHAGWGPKK